jgi:hypothetical protein
MCADVSIFGWRLVDNPDYPSGTVINSYNDGVAMEIQGPTIRAGTSLDDEECNAATWFSGPFATLVNWEVTWTWDDSAPAGFEVD